MLTFCKEVNQNNLAELLPELGCYTIHWADECQSRNQPGCEHDITTVNYENSLLGHVIRAHEEAKIPGEVLVYRLGKFFIMNFLLAKNMLNGVAVSGKFC